MTALDPRASRVVAGWGNALRGDDAAGRRVAEAIAARRLDGVTVLVGHQPLPEWAPILAEAERAYLLDACADLRLRRPRMTRLTAVNAPAPAHAHALDAAAVLALARLLYGRAPEAYLVELPARDLDYRLGLSPWASRMVHGTTRWLIRELESSAPYGSLSR